MPETADRLEEVEQILRRRERLGALLLAAEFIGGLLLGIFLTGTARLEDWFFISSLGPVALTFVLLQRGLGMSRKHAMNFLRRLGPQVHDVSVPRFRPLMIVLNNGLVLRPMGPFSMVWLFFAHGGEILMPRAEEAERWMRKPWRLRRVGVVAPGKGPLQARAELEALQPTLGVKVMGAGIQERRPEDVARDPTGPMWIGFAMVRSLRGLHRIPNVASDFGAIGSLLRSLRGTHFRQTLPTGIRG